MQYILFWCGKNRVFEEDMHGIGSWGSSSSSYAYSALALGMVDRLAGCNCWDGIGSLAAEKRIQV